MRRSTTLYVSDLDGTLLDNNSRISQKTAEILKDLTTRGALITVATARTPATVVPLLKNTRISAPAIVMTGAATWDCNSGRFITTQMMSQAAARRAYEIFVDADVHPFVYTFATDGKLLNVYHPREMNKSEEKFYQERRHMPLKRFHIDCEPDEMDRVALQFAIGPYDRLKIVADRLSLLEDCSVSFYPDIVDHNTALIEVFTQGVSKAQAVKDMAAQYAAERIVVFGDNLNDLPMMRVADTAVAVANALDEVREAADIVIGPNGDDAVARFICEDFGL